MNKYILYINTIIEKKYKKTVSAPIKNKYNRKPKSIFHA